MTTACLPFSGTRNSNITRTGVFLKKIRLLMGFYLLQEVLNDQKSK